MKSTQPELHTCAKALLLAALSLVASQAPAATQLLRADTVTVMMPGGTPVAMWGYAADNAACGTTGVTVPGPAIVVPVGDPALTVTLKNCLNAPTSLVINGQQVSNPVPVWTDGTSGARGSNLTKRVRSFTHEALAGGGTAAYVWSNLKPGTYLYESGTHPQVQVQMGLYGSLTKDTDVGNVAYRQGSTNIAYSNQVTLLYSEIDPVLHAAVSGGTYGPCPIASPGCGNVTSTLEYKPKYFLINGKPFIASTPISATPPVATVPAGQGTLLRFLNASLKTHVPTINGQYWKMIAEDGNPYPYLNNPRQQYTAFLAPGKTMDVLLTPSNPSATDTVRTPIFDSRHFDTNNGARGGGLLAYLDVTPAATTAAAPLFDSAPVTTGTVGIAYSYTAHATDPNGDAVTYSLTGFPPGMSIGASSGLINWTPPAAGTYAVSVRATDTTLPTPLFSDQAYSIIVTAPPNSPPIARNDSYTAVAHVANLGTQVVAAPGVLANDTDADGNALHTGNKLGSSRVALNANGGFTLTSANNTTPVTFTYQALDTSNAASGTATVNITVVANRRPTTVADAFTAPRCTVRVGTTSSCFIGAGGYVPLTLNLPSNDTDPDTATIDVANQLPLSVARLRRTNSGNGIASGTLTTSIGGLVTFTGTAATGVKVTYTPVYNFAGTDTFQYKVQDRLGLTAGNTNAQGWVTVTITVQ